ncbi:MAG: DHH family phosphoesterase [Burkholderiales bacterium]|nr:DHH family phosphoesterase [Burkholderiales bacterium]
MTRLHQRDVPPRTAFALEQAGVHPLLARLLAARGVRSADELDDALARLLPPETLAGAADAGRLLADAVAAGERICIVADYDCDGATACAVALRGLAMLGAAPGTLGYVVPDRARHGYGLTPAIVELAQVQRPALLVTVDNGIASVDGVAHARALGMRVIVTDHHLPAVDAAGLALLPPADAIVDPSQPGCGFASKAIAGVGVMFYVLLAARAALRARGAFDAAAQPRLDALLDLVALGTVADVVRLDANNRRLVAQGLRRIRAGRMQPGVAALFAAAGRDPRRAAGFDLGFALGPRINAAGRLADMTLGIECLLADDPARAAELAQQLDAINRERREVEAGMRAQAEALVERLQALACGGEAGKGEAGKGEAGKGEAGKGEAGGGEVAGAGAGARAGARAGAGVGAGAGAVAGDGAAGGTPRAAVALYDPGFHEGVVGIVAGRLKDMLHRPTFVFARGADGRLKGSGRSIPGFHLRDALDLVAKRHPGVLLRFGGHAMAAGCTIDEGAFATFDAALQAVAAEWLDAATLTRTLPTDGPLALQWFNAETAALLDAQVWGPGFEPPVFCDEVEVLAQRLVGDKHLKLRVRHAGQLRDAIWFGHADPLPARARLAYRLALDEWQGQQRVQMVVEAAG